MQMPSGNKIIGNLQYQYMDLNIYILSKILTQGLCGSFDGNQTNDLFNRFTNQISNCNNGIIDQSTSASWRSDRITLSVVTCNLNQIQPTVIS